MDVCFCHFLLAQKVTKKGTTKTNHLLVLVAQCYTPGLDELVVRTFRGQPTRRQLLPFDAPFVNSGLPQGKLLLLPLRPEPVEGPPPPLRPEPVEGPPPPASP